MLKSEFYGWLKLERPTVESGQPFPPAYCHFPELQEEFFRQLTAEQYRIARRKGTEPAYTGEYAFTHDEGVYRCVCCGAPRLPWLRLRQV